MRSNRSRALALLAAALGAAVIGTAVGVGLFRLLAPPRFHGTAYTPPEPAPAFRLTDQAGRPVALADLRGEAVLLYFGYTRCPDVCPFTLDRLHRALRAVGAGPGEVRVLMVTVDPAHDTAAELGRYLRRFGGRVTGLTGSPAEIARVARAYGVYAETRAPDHAGHSGAAAAPMIAHTDAVFGIDRQGRLRVLLRPQGPEAELADDVRALLRARAAR